MKYHFETFVDKAGRKMYKFRCSATCPYPDCVIISNMPPIQGGEGEGDGNTQSNSQSGVHSNAGGSNSTSTQNQESDQGAGEGSGGNQQSSSKMGGHSDGRDRGSGGERPADQKDNQGSSGDSAPEDVREERYSKKNPKESGRSQGGSTSDSSRESPQDKDSQDGRGNQPEEQKKPAESNGSRDGSDGSDEGEQRDRKSGDSSEGQSSAGGSGGDEGNKQDSGKSEQPREGEQEREQKGRDVQEEVSGASRQEKREVEYKPVYIGEALSNGFTGGQGVGVDDTVIANLGKHNKREKIITDAVFQTKLRNVMKDNAYDRYVKGRKRGRLDMRGLYKVPAKAENVFMLKEARKNKHYNVILIVDQSGSMFDGIKINTAAECAAFLARSLGKADINYAVIGFSGDWRYHKKFADNATDDFLKKMKYDILHTGGGGTSLYAPIKGAYQELRKTPTHQNIVINLTDGWPSSPEACRKYVRGNRHVAEFVDIGIHSKPIMSNGIMINNVQELKPLLLRELKKRIKRG